MSGSLPSQQSKAYELQHNCSHFLAMMHARMLCSTSLWAACLHTHWLMLSTIVNQAQESFIISEEDQYNHSGGGWPIPCHWKKPMISLQPPALALTACPACLEINSQNLKHTGGYIATTLSFPAASKIPWGWAKSGWKTNTSMHALVHTHIFCHPQFCNQLWSTLQCNPFSQRLLACNPETDKLK